MLTVTECVANGTTSWLGLGVRHDRISGLEFEREQTTDDSYPKADVAAEVCCMQLPQGYKDIDGKCKDSRCRCNVSRGVNHGPGKK